MQDNTPSLFGIVNSNHDFTNAESWGKNVFNNAFPVALTCYMYSKGINPVYLTLDEQMTVRHGEIASTDLFGLEWNSPNIRFDFESGHDKFQSMVRRSLPRIDLVVKNLEGNCIRPLEIKLTTLPDNSTCELSPEKFSTEIVVRPDTIVYLATSIALGYVGDKEELRSIMEPVCGSVRDWSNTEEILEKRQTFISLLNSVLTAHLERQSPLVMQPIWKTDGKSVRLADYCLDVFVWSDYAFTRLFTDSARDGNTASISRQYRSVVWLIKMLYEFSVEGQFDQVVITDRYAYNTRNDKAFAVSGIVTHFYLNSQVLTNPRISKSELKNIILGGGQTLLSPERRLDAVIANTPDVFNL